MKRKLFLITLGILCSFSLIQSANKVTTASVKKFMEKEIPQSMKKNNVLGIVVTVVKNNRIIYSKGFGYEDATKKRKVTSNNTLFRIGSVSKLFIWTAIMQLKEKGLLKLDDPVNKYLNKDLMIPAFSSTPPRPLLIKDLMTHTTGFEDKVIGLFAYEENYVADLKKYIKENRPKIVITPGTEISYSNYGVALAGLIIEKISGLKYEDYIEKNILQILNMNKTTFKQQLPDNLKKIMSQGVTFDGKNFITQKFEFVNASPAGSGSATAEDMGRFIMAHLNFGTYNGRRILKTETSRAMQKTLFTSDPRMNGLAHGFIEMGTKELRIIGHGGDTILFHSGCFFLPKEKIGIFISNNTSTGMLAIFNLYGSFIEKFFAPKKGKEIAKGKIFSKDLSIYEGFYRGNRRSESDFTKIMSMGMSISVSMSKDKKALMIKDPLTRIKYRCVEIDDGIFQDEKGSMRYIFINDKNGKPVKVMLNMFPVITFLKADFHENIPFNAVILVLALITATSGFIFRPTGLIALLSKKIEYSSNEKEAGLTAFIISSATLFYLIGLIAILNNKMIYKTPSTIHLNVLYIAVPAIVAGLFFLPNVWKKNYWKLAGRIHYTVIVITAIFFQWFVWYWNLV